MGLNGKDMVTTLVALIVAGVMYARVKGIEIPFPQSVRWGTLIFLIAGVVMCSMGTANPNNKNMYMIGMAILGSLAVVAGMGGIVLGSEKAMTYLGWIILAKWAVTFISHIARR